MKRPVVSIVVATVVVVALGTPAFSTPSAPGLRAHAHAAAATSVASAFALLGVGPRDLADLGSLTRAPRSLGTIDGPTNDAVEYPSINAAGTAGLTASEDYVVPVVNPDSVPSLGTPLSLAQFVNEGFYQDASYPDAVAISGASALVAVGEQGLVQLKRSSAGWEIDTRVQSPGMNEGDTAHLPGFIRIGAAQSGYAFNGVATSSTPLANGQYLGLAIDRIDGVIAVLEGVGTASVHSVAVLSDPSLSTFQSYLPTMDDFGTAGVAFSPVTATRAAVATPTGVSVLNLTNPSHPVLQSATSTSAFGLPDAVAVSRDGDHVAVAAGDTVAVFRGLLGTPAGRPLTPVASDGADDAGTTPAVLDVGYLNDNDLVMIHGSSAGFDLTMLTSATSTSLAVGKTLPLTESPQWSSDLAVWSPPLTVALDPAKLAAARVGQKVHDKLSVSNGIGTYKYTMTKGKLPKGLRLHAGVISGVPKEKGTSHVTLRAKNQYGSGVGRNYTIDVKAAKKKLVKSQPGALRRPG